MCIALIFDMYAGGLYMHSNDTKFLYFGQIDD